MGKFKEYVHMMSKGVGNISNVISGNFNLLKESLGLLPLDQQEEAERRYNICMGCPFMSENAKKIGFYNTQRAEQHCSVCKCPIEAKVMAFNDSCGLNLLEEKSNEQGQLIGGLVGYKPLWGPYTPAP